MRNNNPSLSLSTDVDVPIRLRRAINLNDVVLVKRIIKNNPGKLKNPDLNDNGNTSLHLAAQLGFLDIAQFLVDFGHEDDAVSRNVSWDTPLHLAVETSDPIAVLLATRFPQCIPWKNKQGADVQQVPAAPQLLLSTLLRLSPVPPKSLLTATDLDGNTALHYASAYGQLKAIRALLAAGANPGAGNKYSWTPVAYSSTVQAEVYFKGLVGGVNESGGAGSSGRGEAGVGLRREGESGGLSRGGGGSGLRIVRTGEEMGSAIEMRGGDGRRRAGSAE
ncbi:MAG: hypothetical protein L6R42_000980 [Xanthoria sp. 1 TBL-2021]|nr:MAG: hypothetical protein L6R42_000980 [Xanthoria sp. 1 TBL-2021]